MKQVFHGINKMPRPRTGYITKNKAGTWRGVVRVTDPLTGQQAQRQVTAPTKTEARNQLNKLLAEINSAQIKPDNATFAELTDLFERNRCQPAQYLNGRKVNGLKEPHKTLSLLNVLRKHFDKVRLSSLGVAEIEAFKAARIACKTKQGERRNIATINREMEMLKRVLNYGVKLELIAANPCERVHNYLQRGLEEKRHRVPTFGEEMALLAAARTLKSDLAHCLIIAADTGLRRGEITSLEWSDVDFAASTLTVRAINAKTNRARTVPLTRRVTATLRTLEASKRNQYPLKGQRDFKRALQAALKLAKITDLHTHDFRHAFVTRSILVGVPLAVVVKSSGHASDEWQRYLNTDASGARALFEPLEGQDAGEVKAFGREILQGLKDALGFDLDALLGG